MVMQGSESTCIAGVIVSESAQDSATPAAEPEDIRHSQIADAPLG
jgi:hypothetical protein